MNTFSKPVCTQLPFTDAAKCTLIRHVDAEMIVFTLFSYTENNFFKQISGE